LTLEGGMMRELGRSHDYREGVAAFIEKRHLNSRGNNMAAIDKGSVVAVIGSGAMGAGIAQVAAVAGYTVKLYDTRPEAVAKAIADIGKRSTSW
jgi:threonine dehydrogenase-like Zn-dependent dehydrogenase